MSALMFRPYLIDAFIGFACLAVATCHGLLNVLALLAWRIPRSRRVAPATAFEGVTILKPLCGDEPGLYEDLRSFCLQDYPAYQIVFGLADHSDPAREVAERLKREFHGLSIEIVVDARMHGSNAKVSNLINMLPYADHDVLAIVDSDSSVGADYLRSVISPLQEEGVGLVTCLYRSLPTPGVWSHLGAMYVNDWYMPAVVLAWFLGHRNYVSGQTICIRQATLRVCGGLSAVANYLAEDYRLGECVRSLGLRIVLSPYVVTGQTHEPSLGALIRAPITQLLLAIFDVYYAACSARSDARIHGPIEPTRCARVIRGLRGLSHRVSPGAPYSGCLPGLSGSLVVTRAGSANRMRLVTGFFGIPHNVARARL
jgi:ceramide glucosyltransferase